MRTPKIVTQTNLIKKTETDLQTGGCQGGWGWGWDGMGG